MPWSPAQVRTAQAVEHGWKPKGGAKGFTKDFASQVVQEGSLKRTYAGKRGRERAVRKMSEKE